MKRLFVTTILLCAVVGFGEAGAQEYYPGYYEPYWDGSQYQPDAQQYDPYYELHVLHYQLYKAYPTYPYCCALAPGIIVVAPARPHGSVKPQRPPMTRK